MLTFQSALNVTFGIAGFNTLTFIGFFLAAGEADFELNVPAGIIQ
jgi:hypothetical protein